MDYEGTSPQSERGINVVLNYTTAYTTFGVKCAISPDVPNNDGSIQPIRVTAPEGSILNAQHPGAEATETPSNATPGWSVATSRTASSPRHTPARPTASS